MKDPLITPLGDPFNADIDEWYVDAGGDYEDGETSFWQVCGVLWNHGAFREEYRLRRPLTDDPGRDDWEIRMVKGTNLGMRYQWLKYSDEHDESELTETYGTATEADML